MSVHFAAEVSSNHSQNLERCLKFIDVSAEVGCSSVKFQLFKVDQLFIPEVVSKRKEIAYRKVWELPVSFLPAIADRCHERKIEFSCTPFYLKAVEELYPFVDYFKIASYELLWTDLLKECAQTGKPIVLSTGMATLEEVKTAVETLTDAGCKKLALLHCSSAYPAPSEYCNLAAIDTLKNAFRLPVGWSDHTVQPAVIYRAIHRWNAKMIEFHLDLEGEGEEFSSGHCWLPEQIATVINDINTGIIADGTDVKGPTENEERERNWRADPTDGLRPLKEIRDRWWEK
jgi:sialic acid synthase SpsE